MTHILPATEIQLLMKKCREIKADLQNEKRNATKMSLINLQNTLNDIRIPVTHATRDNKEEMWIQKQHDYEEEINNTKEPIRIRDLSGLKKELDGLQEAYRKMQLTRDLPMDLDLLNLKIKEKMMELEDLRVELNKFNI